ncbi:RsmB/NOP family class I SAM-dependent RNA methyltransferase [Yoonia sp. R2331]|uniref:RsmB/NOP family class I SAM-dependent RNA methyltransferase n=1 Tax=Yoonia sp. R2331 TaxID=3237238 RepID=UPI0034E4D054
MTPAARYAAAIEILDLIGAAQPAEQVLTTWARQNRFAGSKDRAAIRDHVYDVLRQKRSVAAWGGGTGGRALILGLLRKGGVDPTTVFGAGGYGPTELTTTEAAPKSPEMTDAEAFDMPDWLWPTWQADLGDQARETATCQQNRAPVSLRVNLRSGSRDTAQLALADDGVKTEPIADIKTALQVVENPRRVAVSAAFQNGLVELQDAASQWAMQTVAPFVGGSVLDYCAGGGGKALALADMTDAQITAHDIAARRMADIPARAARADVSITIAVDAPKNMYDLVLCDAPCSGSGTWRRTPEAKWTLNTARLAELSEMQRDVIRQGAKRVKDDGHLAYATCSVLHQENDEIVDDFLKEHPDFRLTVREQLLPTHTHDGFFLAILQLV